MRNINKVLESPVLETVINKNVMQKLDSKELEPTYYSQLKAEEQLFVQFITFAGLSMERAAYEVVERIKKKVPTYKGNPDTILMEYRMRPDVQNAIEEIIEVKDREYSLMIQNDAKMSRDIIRAIALTSQDEEMRFKAAETLLKAAEADFKNKRAKQKAQVENNFVSNQVTWKIEMSEGEDVPEEAFVVDAEDIK